MPYTYKHTVRLAYKQTHALVKFLRDKTRHISLSLRSPENKYFIVPYSILHYPSPSPTLQDGQEAEGPLAAPHAHPGGALDAYRAGGRAGVFCCRVSPFAFLGNISNKSVLNMCLSLQLALRFGFSQFKKNIFSLFFLFFIVSFSSFLQSSLADFS